MKKLLAGMLLSVTMLCCNDKDAAGVSNIKIDINVKRFEQDFFALDTNHLVAGIQQLQQKYPGFTNDFIEYVLGLNNTAVKNPEGTEAAAVRIFLKDYKPLKDSSDKIFGNFEKEKKEIVKGLQYLKYYFPNYKTPGNIITFIGPMDAFFQTSFGTMGDILTREGPGIGLQLHLGNNFSYYKSLPGQALYPEYISKTFTPEYIAVNCMKNIIDDMYEDNSNGRALIEQMVEKGKRLYLLDKLLPGTPEFLKIGYTQKELENTYKNEAVIWNFFLTNEMLNNQEQNIIKNYIGESPKTDELGEGAPGNIGSFAGWQVVKKYMSKNPEVTPEKMMKTDAREIYTSAKYKPRA